VVATHVGGIPELVDTEAGTWSRRAIQERLLRPLTRRFGKRGMKKQLLSVSADLGAILRWTCVSSWRKPSQGTPPQNADSTLAGQLLVCWSELELI
jgi:hypothetical protein